MQATTIRKATLDDAAEVARLRWDFSPEEVAKGTQSYEAWRAGFENFVHTAFNSESWTVWVAEQDDRIVMNIWVYLVPKVPRPGQFGKRLGYVTNVYAEPDVRNAGIGSAVMEQVIAWARQEALELLLVWPSTESRRFYARAGFLASTETMELLLEDQ